MVMKNGHRSSLPANTKSQRAVLPPLLGAAAGDSSFFWGSSKMSVLCVLEHTGEAPRPQPSPGRGAARGERRAGRGGEGVGCVRVPGVCARILARGR